MDTNHATKETFPKLDRLARGQHGLVTTTQLAAIGIEGDARRHLIRTGRLVPVRRGVCRLCGSRPTWRAAALAAVLAAGGGAVLSHHSAAALWGLMEEQDLEGRLHLTAPALQQIRLTGVTAHRRLLLPGDVVRRHAIPATSVERTLLDLAEIDSATLTGRLLDAALRRRLTTMTRLMRATAALEGRGRRRMAPAQKLLADRSSDYRPGANDWEYGMDQLWDQLGLPPAERQYAIRVAGGRRFVPDRVLVEARITVDWNGYGQHGLRTQFESDIERRNLLIAAGWTPLEFHSNQTARHIARTVLQVYQAQCATSLPAS